MTDYVHGYSSRETERIDTETWTRGIRDLHQVINRTDGTFTYTFFKAVGTKR